MSNEIDKTFENTSRISLTKEINNLLNDMLKGHEELVEIRNNKFQAGATLLNVLKYYFEKDDIGLLPFDDIEEEVVQEYQERNENSSIKDVLLKEIENIKIETKKFVDEMPDMSFDEQDEEFERLASLIDDIYSKLNLTSEEINNAILDLRNILNYEREEHEVKELLTAANLKIDLLEKENNDLKETIHIKQSNIISKNSKSNNNTDSSIKDMIDNINKKVDLQLIMLEMKLNSSFNLFGKQNFMFEQSQPYKLAAKILKDSEVVVIPKKHHGGAFHE